MAVLKMRKINICAMKKNRKKILETVTTGRLSGNRRVD